MLKGFRDFVLRGNMLDLAVAVVIGAAFNGIVDSLVRDILTPLLGLIGGDPDFSAFAVGPVRVGAFLNALLAFLIKAAGLYFFVLAPLKRLVDARILPPPLRPPPSPDVVILGEIRDLLRERSPAERP
ncbi:MAG: large conductance mechanosensitive channel protein MscL [Pseudomonadota bacterium]|nr:large conductance mechanosensitive channel protein MscL [Pseudomonadota bacterium]